MFNFYAYPELRDLSQGSRIAFARHFRHKTQDYVSKELGLTGDCRRRSMTRYEKGDRNPKEDRTKAIAAPHMGFPVRCAGRDIKIHIQETAQAYGIPPYYYTQLQQQLLALNAPFGYLAAMFDKGWEFKVFKIFADLPTQTALADISKEVWDRRK